ncbi:MAG: competence/damage-inducible protein A [Bacteroidetes bacterium HGW-Bacteroidetes-2]|jgi:nicotinamide-nucleotide amidase|nr:MAG: competence/damage-inducible protein A [Bacteroidetes bacterium HGW-Bacteroidetes-2]
MFAEIITIGDEILIGQIVDTNSAYIASELSKIGVQVVQITSVQDLKNPILESFANAKNRADVVLITGGLGPTKDDITKRTFCDFFQDVLVLNQDALDNINELFEKHVKRIPNELNKQQALVPSKAIALKNNFGTAPGMWMEEDNTVFISLPGVPFEMKGLMQNEVLPRLQKRFHRPFIVHKTILTSGMGESAIAEIIEDWENALPAEIKLAYLPSLGRVRLRLSTKGMDESALHAAINSQMIELERLIGNSIVGYDNETSIEEVIAKLLIKQNKTLSLAESCTGGQMAKQITAIEGASEYFRGGFVTYATDTKTKLLGVPKELIDAYTVVSAPVVEAMALGAKKRYESDYAVSTTGIAGPTKGDGKDEIGTVFIGIASPNGVFSEKFHFGNQRSKVMKSAVNMAFTLLRKEILKN